MKISRNDPCPCGSGMKYKKCCLRDDLEALEPEDARTTQPIGSTSGKAGRKGALPSKAIPPRVLEPKVRAVPPRRMRRAL